jgi:hypothetical protein
VIKEINMARRSNGGGLSQLSVADLRRELSRRQRHGGALIRRREKLAAKLERLDAMIADLGLSGSHANGHIVPGRKRFHNESNLADALAKALHGKTLSVGEAMEAVQKAGYRTTARNFRVIVNLTLTKDKRFKRVERGQYTAR